jgi:hypothetical protein
MYAISGKMSEMPVMMEAPLTNWKTAATRKKMSGIVGRM